MARLELGAVVLALVGVDPVGAGHIHGLACDWAVEDRDTVVEEFGCNAIEVMDMVAFVPLRIGQPWSDRLVGRLTVRWGLLRVKRLAILLWMHL